MARQGIYVNGKEIVARYVGNKLVWKKNQWVKVKSFDFYYYNYSRDYSTYTDAYLTQTQWINSSNSTLPSDEQYPNLTSSYDGEYKVIMGSTDALDSSGYEMMLASIIIRNMQSRRKNILSVTFKFKSEYDREIFMNRLQRNPHFELYRKE